MACLNPAIELSEAETECFGQVNAKLKELGGAHNAYQLPMDMQLFLKAKAQAWREKKHTAPRADNWAVVQDVRMSLEAISNEVSLTSLSNDYLTYISIAQLMALTARTDIQTFLFVVKGKAEHTVEGFVAASEKSACYLLHGMKKHSADILKEFESYVLGDVAGMCLFFG